jgi:hypothetical protein
MARKIGIEINDRLTDQEYADPTNTVWMLMRLTSYDFDILRMPCPRPTP